MFVARRPFRDVTMVSAGSVVEPAGIRRFKNHLYLGHIIEISEEEVPKWAEFFKVRYGVDLLENIKKAAEAEAEAEVEAEVEVEVEVEVEAEAEAEVEAEAEAEVEAEVEVEVLVDVTEEPAVVKAQPVKQQATKAKVTTAKAKTTKKQ